MATDTITLTQHVLGLRPFVLIEFKQGPDGEDDLRADVSGGGGISTVAEIRAALEMALDALPNDEPDTTEAPTATGEGDS